MAVGTEGIKSIETGAHIIDERIHFSEGMKRNHVTFEYVTNYLENWATETDIGYDVRETLKKLCDLVKEINDNVTELAEKVLPEFCEQQTNINNGNE